MKKLGLLIVALMFSGHLLAQTLDDMLFITENYAPFNYKAEGKLQGITVDALVEMLQLVNAKQTRKDIKLWPWAKGYSTIQKKKNTSLFAMTRTEPRENLFKWVGPITPSQIVLTAKKSKQLTVHSFADLGPYKIVAVRDDVGEQLLAGATPKKLYRANSSKSAAKMLSGDKVDMWAYGSIVALWNLRQQGFDVQEYETVYTLKHAYNYYAFHKDTDEKIITKLQSALDQLKQNGRLDAIIKNYQ